MANMLYYDMIGIVFKLQSVCFVHFPTNILAKSIGWSWRIH